MVGGGRSATAVLFVDMVAPFVVAAAVRAAILAIKRVEFAASRRQIVAALAGAEKVVTT
jgi:hypothetical protein